MKKTFFNNSTKGGDLQTPTKTKRKVLKTFSFTSLAILMGIAGTMAFAPLGASPNLANASEAIETTTEQGLITPKADDPVIYTTESGLEIKWGNALPDTINSSLSSGNLSGFPYFTTQSGSTTYTWVIIGRNSNVTTLNTAVQSYLFSTWKTNNSSSNDWKFGNSFFDNTYETTTPAGSAINNVVPSKSYINDNISFSISDITTNDDEIPNGCVLCLSNSLIETCMFYAGSDYENFNSTPCIATEAQTFAGTSNTVRTKCANYYTNDSFGFGTYKSSLQNITLKQNGCYNPGQSSGNLNMFSNTFITTQLHFFPLATNSIVYYDYTQPNYQNSGGNMTYKDSNFCVQSYLSTNQLALGTTYWLRNMHATSYISYVDANGKVVHGAGIQSIRGIRPAMVMQLN